MSTVHVEVAADDMRLTDNTDGASMKTGTLTKNVTFSKGRGYYMVTKKAGERVQVLAIGEDFIVVCLVGHRELYCRVERDDVHLDNDARDLLDEAVVALQIGDEKTCMDKINAAREALL